MKYFTMLFIMLSLTQVSNGQNTPWSTSTSEIGIGITTPETKFHVNSNSSSPAIRVSMNHPGNIDNAWVDLGVAFSNNAYSPLALRDDIVLRAAPGNGKFLLTNTGLGSTVFATGGFGNETERMVITVDGNIGIGKSDPTDKLEVNGRIHARSVKVDLDDWPDYVFKSSYMLKPLNEIESYIQLNGHLEGVPNADIIVSEGLDLGAMEKIMMEKIEELTLHLIKKDKEIKSLEIENTRLKNGYEELSKRLETLETKMSQ